MVFTFKTVVNKVDQDQKPLTGAAFKLEKLVGETWTPVKEFTVDEEKPADSLGAEAPGAMLRVSYFSSALMRFLVTSRTTAPTVSRPPRA